MAGSTEFDFQPGQARRSVSIGLFLFLALTGCTIDLVSKSMLFARLYDPAERWQEPWWLAGQFFGFQTSLNPGALFGLGHGYSYVFAGISVVFQSLILFWLLFLGGWRDRWMVVATGLISAGILGNFYDRIGLGFAEGYPESARYCVRDWILFRLEGVPFFDPWPNFNLADSFLVVGAGLVLIHALFISAKKPEPAGVGSPEVTS